MKRKELIRELIEAGCILHRNGARHDLYINSITGKKQPIPRHNEIDDRLANHIKRMLGIF
ncbi:MAG: type II toxin-antitoxin system HicA family toxin [Nitrospirae bacterium]|nr:type II toxin-antitoxin system HicA family toxin [Nitrospirota bacterium]